MVKLGLRNMSSITSAVRIAVLLVVLFICAFFMARYLRWTPESLIRIIIFVVLAVSVRKGLPFCGLARVEVVCLAIGALLFAVSLVLGYHIMLTSSPYFGTMESNYISAYSWIDLVAFPFLWVGVVLLICAAYRLIKERVERAKRSDVSESAFREALEPISWKVAAAFAAVIFFCWIPYLLVYWPGFIFGDTLDSFAQIESGDYRNHHPVAYTMFIRVCLWIARIFGFGPTVGCALCSVIQMLFMAGCFGFIFAWIVQRARVRRFWGWVLAVVYGGTPYIATYSIAMWKDPIFLTAIAIVSILLMDLALSRGKVAVLGKQWAGTFFVFLLIAVFSRNNGVFVIALCAVCLLILGLICRRKGRPAKGYLVAFGCSAVSVALFVTIAGPVFAGLGIAFSPKVESYGILLNQMARVAATDGVMSEDDRVYLDELLPIERYAEAYRPACVDMLKWDEEFNTEAVDERFLGHWFSLLMKNPVCYFEAWELETCGFWTVNVPTVIDYTGNISSGVPRNLSEEYIGQVTDRDIYPQNLLGSDEVRRILNTGEQSVPVGLVNWCVLFLALFLVLLGRPAWVLPLLPSIGIALTLMIASPLWYWPRYGAAAQFLLPFYACMLVMLMRAIYWSDSDIDRSRHAGCEVRP